MMLSAAFATTVYSQGSMYQAREFIQVNKEDTVRNNFMAAGRSVEIDGYMDDIFISSEQLNINGTVNDDAMLAARNITLKGLINDMLLSVGETITIDGVIEGDMFIAGRQIRIGPNARIGGDAGMAAGTIHISEGSTINGRLWAAGGELNMDGTVNGPVKLYSDNVTFGPNYAANGGTTLTSTEKINRNQLGEAPPNLIINIQEENFWGMALFQLWFFLSLLLTGWILILLFQSLAIEIQQFASQHFWRNTGIGVISFIIIPVAVILLFILVITVPLAILLSLAYGFALFISYLLVALVLGVLTIKYFKRDITTSVYYWGLLLGMVIIAVLTNIPYVGGIINLLFIFFGLGSVTYFMWTRRRAAVPHPQT